MQETRVRFPGQAVLVIPKVGFSEMTVGLKTAIYTRGTSKKFFKFTINNKIINFNNIVINFHNRKVIKFNSPE